jgi:hypothetical protein
MFEAEDDSGDTARLTTHGREGRMVNQSQFDGAGEERGNPMIMYQQRAWRFVATTEHRSHVPAKLAGAER